MLTVTTLHYDSYNIMNVICIFSKMLSKNDNNKSSFYKGKDYIID